MSNEPSDTLTAQSEASIFDDTEASDDSIYLDETFGDMSDVGSSLSTASFGTCQENVTTSRRRSSTDTCQEILGTCRSELDTGIEDVRTCVSSPSLGTCESRASLATCEIPVDTSKSLDDLRTANENDQTCRSTSFSISSLGTCLENLGTSISDSLINTCQGLLATCISRSSIATCLDNVSTVNNDETCQGVEDTCISRTSSLETCAENVTTCRSEIDITRQDQEIVAVVDDNELNAIFSKYAELGTAASKESIRSCSMESLKTANENYQIDELGRVSSIYCIDDSGESATNSLLFAVPSQYQLAELHTYSGLQNPDTAYQYRLQEVLPPNRSTTISATKSEYLLPAMAQ